MDGTTLNVFVDNLGLLASPYVVDRGENLSCNPFPKGFRTTSELREEIHDAFRKRLETMPQCAAVNILVQIPLKAQFRDSHTFFLEEAPKAAMAIMPALENYWDPLQAQKEDEQPEKVSEKSHTPQTTKSSNATLAADLRRKIDACRDFVGLYNDIRLACGKIIVPWPLAPCAMDKNYAKKYPYEVPFADDSKEKLNFTDEIDRCIAGSLILNGLRSKKDTHNFYTNLVPPFCPLVSAATAVAINPAFLAKTEIQDFTFIHSRIGDLDCRNKSKHAWYARIDDVSVPLSGQIYSKLVLGSAITPVVEDPSISRPPGFLEASEIWLQESLLNSNVVDRYDRSSFEEVKEDLMRMTCDDLNFVFSSEPNYDSE